MAQDPRGAALSGPAVPPPGIGTTALRLLAEESVPRILRTLQDGPLSIPSLSQRLPDVAPATLAKRLRSARDAEAVSRHESPHPGGPAAHRLTRLGHELHTLFGSAHEWVVHGPGADTDEPGRLSLTATILGALANGTGRSLLHAVDEGATLPAALEHQLRDLTHVTIGRLVQKHEKLRLLEREGRPGGRRSRPIHVTRFGREAVAFVAEAARLEELHTVPGAVPPVPVEAARLLRFAAPLMEPRAREQGALRVTIDPHPARPAEPVSFLLQTGENVVLAIDSSPTAAVSAEARAPIPAWCEAVVKGERDGLVVTGNAGLAERLLGGLHERLFPPVAVAEEGEEKAEADGEADPE